MTTNTTIFFDVFKELNDHVSWNKHIEYASRNEDVDQNTKNMWIESLRYLRTELGSGFLRTGGKSHPVVKMVVEKAKWRTNDLIEFVNTLKKLKESNGNYGKLIGKLRSRKISEREGMPFLEIAQMYLKEEFSICFPDEIEGRKNPDIEVMLPFNRDRFFIEVSKVEESQERRLLDGNYRVLSNVLDFADHYLPFSCAQLRYIEPNEMQGVLETIRNIRRKALIQKDIVHYHDDMIRLSVSHADKFQELQSWIETYDYRNGLLGAPLNFDETERICNYKISQKVKQIPASESGILYLPVNALFFWGFKFDEAVSKFQRQMIDHSNLLGVALFAYLIHDIQPVSLSLQEHHYGIKKMNDAVIRHFLFIRNPNYQGTLKQDTIKHIYATFQ